MSSRKRYEFDTTLSTTSTNFLIPNSRVVGKSKIGVEKSMINVENSMINVENPMINVENPMIRVVFALPFF